MNNLKRVLSLALSGIMLVGMMAVSASAAEFSDAEKIEHADAVNTLVALKVINGKDDGSFDPEGDVTRGQMAKMIAVAMNGGTDTNTGVKGTATFTDIKGHWAESYIEYCYDLGVINGRGDGTFDPEGKVTTIEATKMVLTALGYDAKAYELTGAKWATQTDQLARMAKPNLYDELGNVTLNANASRDTAAQLIWNGLQNLTVRINPDEGRNDGTITWGYGKTTQTLLEERFNATVGFGYMTKVEYDSDAKKYEYTVSKSDNFGADASEDNDISDDGNTLPNNIKIAEDVSDLFGQKVKVVYKRDKAQTIYGVFGADSSVLVEGVVGSLPTIKATDESVKYDDTSYKLQDDASTIAVYYYNDKDATTVNKTLDSYKDDTTKPYSFQLIDNDGDGKANCVVVTPITVAKVTFVGKNSITAGNASYKFSDCDIYEDVAVDEYAVVIDKAYTKNDTTVLTKAEVVKGEVGALRSEDDTRVRMDGTWYVDVEDRAGDEYSLGDEFELAVVNGYVFYAKAITSTTNVENAVYALKVDSVGTGTKEGTQTVRLLFADNSKKVVTVDKVNTKDAAKLDKIAADNDVKEGTVYTYATDKDGNYELTNIKDKDFKAAGANAASTALTIDGGKVNEVPVTYKDDSTGEQTLRFSDSAVIFVKAKNETKAISGAVVNKWKNIDTTDDEGASKMWANQSSNGFYTVALGLLTVDADTVPGAVGDTSYGWLTADSARVKDGEDYFIEMKLWNGSEEVSVKAEGKGDGNTEITSSTTVTDLTKGVHVSYKDLGDGKIDTVVILSGDAAAVTGYDGDKDIEIDGTALEINSDTVIIYVDTAENEGVEGGSIMIAQKDALGGYVKNVYYAAKDGKVTYLFVDTSNNLDENGTFTLVEKSVVTAVDSDKEEITVAASSTLKALIDEIKTIDGFAGAKVVTSKTDDTEVTGDSTELAAGNILQVTSTDGSFYSWTIKV